MSFYSINLEGYKHTSWVLHDVIKTLPKRRKPPEMPSVFYKFFPSADVEVRMKEVYQKICCPKCGRFDSDGVFNIGFFEPAMIRLNGNYGYTNDRIFLIDNKFLEILKKKKVCGYEISPIGKTGWHAFRTTLLVDHDSRVMKNRKPLCSECGRPDESYGLFDYCSQLSLPEQPNTFFSTKMSWPSTNFRDRAIFMTEDVLRALKEGGIAGGYCTRLWTDEEKKKQKEKAKRGIPFWKPPGTYVHLNGK